MACGRIVPVDRDHRFSVDDATGASGTWLQLDYIAVADKLDH